jgi:AraC-like DNA-binding protein
MPKTIFPANFIIDLPQLNIEKMQHYSTMWDIEHTQFTKGMFEGSLLGVHTPRIQMGVSHFSHAIMTQGSFPAGCIVLFYFSARSSKDPSCNFHDRRIAPNEVVILTENDTLDFLTYITAELHTVVIEKNLFYQMFYAFFGDTPDIHIQNKRLYLQADKITLFDQVHTRWISYLSEEFPTLAEKPEYERIEFEILHQLFSCMVVIPDRKKRKKFQVKKVRDMLHENISEGIDIATITDELDIGISQLHQAFKKEYGVSPKRYLQILRYNAIKKELFSADSRSTNITDTALKYYFLQMGHFSTGYKQLFGETPSQTLHTKQ